MTLVKTSLLNGIAVAIKVVTVLILNKVLAVYVGPTGYAIIGQFQNAISILISTSGGLVASGVVKTTAQYYDDEPKQHKIWQTAIRFSLLFSLLTGFVLLFIGDWLSEWLLARKDMGSIFTCLALGLPAMAANNLLLAIVNGKKEVGVYVAANVAGSIVGLFVVGVLAYSFGLYGALLALTISPALVLLTTATLVTKLKWFKSKYLWGRVERGAAVELSGFAMMGITSAILVPVTYILVRNLLVENVGLANAGYWQASWKISEIYLMLFTTTLSVYYLPRLAEIRTAAELKSEISKVIMLVMPIVIMGAFSMYFLRDSIISVLFTDDFRPMRDLFAWQLSGDVIKIGSWIFGYILVGRAMVGYFIVTEVAFAVSFFLFSWFFVDLYSLKGVSIAYAVNYILHLIVMIILVFNELRKMERH